MVVVSSQVMKPYRQDIHTETIAESQIVPTDTLASITPPPLRAGCIAAATMPHADVGISAHVVAQ